MGRGFYGPLSTAFSISVQRRATIVFGGIDGQLRVFERSCEPRRALFRLVRGSNAMYAGLKFAFVAFFALIELLLLVFRANNGRIARCPAQVVRQSTCFKMVPACAAESQMHSYTLGCACNQGRQTDIFSTESVPALL